MMEEVIMYLGIGLEGLMFLALIGYFGFKFYDLISTRKMMSEIGTTLLRVIPEVRKTVVDYLNAYDGVLHGKKNSGDHEDDYIRSEIAKRTPVSMDDLEAETIDDEDSGE